jgi:SulP family sulfate permease
VNYTTGAKSALSAVFSALFLMLIVLLVAPLMAHLPMASMGGVILLVAYGLIDFGGIKRIARVSKSEIAILLLTFFATLFLELEFAIYLGVLLSLMIYLKHTSMPEIAVLAPNPDLPKKKLTHVIHRILDECPQAKIIRIDGTVYFGSANYVQRRFRRISGKEGIKHIIIDCSTISLIDYAGAMMLVEESNRLKKIGGALYFSTMRNRTYEFLKNGGFIDEIGPEYFFLGKKLAIEFVYDRLNRAICSGCTKRIFMECNSSKPNS